MNSGLNSALHYALRSETQCHAPLSQSCLGLQVTSCLPVFLSSGTAGAINQRTPTPTPPEPRCVRLHRPDHHKNNMRLSHLVCRSSRGHFSASINANIVFEVFFFNQAFRTRFLNFRCCSLTVETFIFFVKIIPTYCRFGLFTPILTLGAVLWCLWWP